MDRAYIFFTTIFTTCLVISNLIFQKFIIINIWEYEFFISAGDIVYPITFLLTDIVCEYYGKEHSDLMVKNALFVSIIVMILFYITDKAPTAYFSILSESEFNKVFGKYDIAFMASIIAAYISQTLDIRVFMFLKQLTKHKYLWFRNCVSTFLSQVVDTFIVLVILYFFNIIPYAEFSTIFNDQLLFKISFTIITIPLCYISVHLLRARSLKKPQKKLI